MEVFQDLSIKPIIDIKKLRSELISQASNGWFHDKEKETEVTDHVLLDEDVIVFNREAFNNIDDSLLILWQKGNSYSVTNIVPRNTSELGISRYNEIIGDFLNEIVIPLKEKGILDFTLSKGLKQIDDWLDASSVESLKKFSDLANKSTGASHPLDQRRWIDFLIKSHQASVSLDASNLLKWLVEIEKWPEEIASDLAIEYEFSRDLLKEYDKR